MQIKRVGTITCHAGEGPVWDVEEQALYFIDVFDRLVWRYDPATETFRSWSLPARIGSMAIRARGGAILSLETGFHSLDFATGAVTLIADPQAQPRRTAFNDGKVDQRGRFIAGTIDPKLKEPLGHLYRLDADLRVTDLASDLICMNGPCWSPDGRLFYVTDSMRQTVYKYDYDLATGALSDRRNFADTSSYGGAPDGATVDAEGGWWTTFCGGGKVIRLRADGSLDRVIEMPQAMAVSSVMFGGRNLDRLYITSIADTGVGLPTGPEGGGLFVIDGLGVRGVPEPRFAG